MNSKMIKEQLDSQRSNIRSKLKERRERSLSRSRANLSKEKRLFKNKTSNNNILNGLNSQNEYYGS